MIFSCVAAQEGGTDFILIGVFTVAGFSGKLRIGLGFSDKITDLSLQTRTNFDPTPKNPSQKNPTRE